MIYIGYFFVWVVFGFVCGLNDNYDERLIIILLYFT